MGTSGKYEEKKLRFSIEREIRTNRQLAREIERIGSLLANKN
jgi:hypothetical protein